jgi:hypothetical protein
MTDSTGGGAATPDQQKAFFEMADVFVAAANGLTARATPAQISAAMLYATARWNAFVAQSQGLPPGEIDEEAVAYFRGEYEAALRENLAQVLSSRAVKGI